MDTPRGLTRRGVFMLIAVALLVLLVLIRLTGLDLDFMVRGVTSESGISVVQADIQLWKVNLLRYKTRYLMLPTQAQGLEALVVEPVTGPVPSGHWEQIVKPERLKDLWGHAFQYRNPGKHNPGSYDVFSLGPDGVEGTADDIGNW